MNNDVVSIPPNYPTSTTTPRPTHPHQTAKGQNLDIYTIVKLFDEAVLFAVLCQQYVMYKRMPLS